MTTGQAKQYMARQAISERGVMSGHAAHDNDLCDYADAAAEAAYERMVLEVPKMIKMEMSNPKNAAVDVEIDQRSLAKMRDKVVSAIMSAFR